MSIKRKRFEEEEVEGLRDIMRTFRRICALNRKKEQELYESLHSYIDGRLNEVFNNVGDGPDRRALLGTILRPERKKTDDEC